MAGKWRQVSGYYFGNSDTPNCWFFAGRTCGKAYEVRPIAGPMAARQKAWLATWLYAV